jgi:hypothetical protein
MLAGLFCIIAKYFRATQFCPYSTKAAIHDPNKEV